MLNLDLGAGNQKTPGYISVDKYDKEADLQVDIIEIDNHFVENSVDNVVCYQVIEHLPYQHSQRIFDAVYKILKPNGKAIFETVDFDYVIKRVLEEGLTDKWTYNIYGEYYRPWDKDRYDDWDNCAAAIHRNPWNYRKIEECARRAGFSSVRQRIMEEKNPLYPYEENLSVELIK